MFKKFWADPLLRYSNILDGLFHEKVVVAEADSDCRFYAAVKDSLTNEVQLRRDVMLTHCGGKARIPMVTKALVKVGVPVSVISDIDLLNDEHPLRVIYEALGGIWNEIEKDWRIVKAAVEQKKPELTTKGVRAEIVAALDTATEEYLPKAVMKRIEEIIRRSSPWSIVKQVGRAYIPAGDATQAFERLDVRLRAKGIFVVDVGELEGFDRSVSGHGPKWVNEVLQKDLTAGTFDGARDFVGAALA